MSKKRILHIIDEQMRRNKKFTPKPEDKLSKFCFKWAGWSLL